jgi:hypothetical protein
MKTLMKMLPILCVTALMGGAGAADQPQVTESERLFLTKVKPLLDSRCVSCHGAEKVKAGLRLDSREASLKGGESGPAVVPGKPGESLLLTSVMHAKEDLKMPPKEKLTPQDIAVLERWITAGAPWPDARVAEAIAPKIMPGERLGDAWSDPRNPVVRAFGGQRLDLWSLRPVHAPQTPEVKRQEWARTGLDHFVLAALEAKEIAPPPMASAHDLARRLFFDLHGLPPTPAEVADFESEARTRGLDAAANDLAARLLDSPRFGEHFARFWLDVVRYSDSNGFDWDEFRPEAWRFRDYVIRAFNEDKPYDRFIREHLAGDELVPGAPRTAAEQDALIATGFLRLGPWDNAAGLFNEQDRARSELLADLTETTGSAFLGLTMSCCRCHDHKYDPITQADHFRLRAFFEPVRFADDLPLDLAPEQERIRRHNAVLDERIAKTTAFLNDLLALARARLPAADPKKGPAPEAEVLKGLAAEEKAAHESLGKLRGSLTRQRLPFTHGLVAMDNPKDIPVTRVLFQGDHTAKRDAVEPGFLSVLDPNPARISLPPNPRSSGRRLALANWIASPANPLTARVFVNRVWQTLMGRPLVATANDFGLAGSRPEDAALLDWLASEFVRQGWSVKKLLTLITGSAAYRQAATPAGGFWAIRPPRRLGAESLRDSLLAVSGLLHPKTGGPAVWPDLPQDVLDANPAFLDDNKEKTKGWYPSPKPEQFARSIFTVQKRNTRLPILETFDLPDNSTPCARRNVSTVAPQALTLLNSPLAIEAARAFADRVQRESGGGDDQTVRHAFALALQREPSAREHSAAVEFVQRRTLTELCRALLNLNEFAYFD